MQNQRAGTTTLDLRGMNAIAHRPEDLRSTATAGADGQLHDRRELGDVVKRRADETTLLQVLCGKCDPKQHRDRVGELGVVTIRAGMWVWRAEDRHRSPGLEAQLRGLGVEVQELPRPPRNRRGWMLRHPGRSGTPAPATLEGYCDRCMTWVTLQTEALLRHAADAAKGRRSRIVLP
jgi:hypothetical protein